MDVPLRPPVPRVLYGYLVATKATGSSHENARFASALIRRGAALRGSGGVVAGRAAGALTVGITLAQLDGCAARVLAGGSRGCVITRR